MLAPVEGDLDPGDHVPVGYGARSQVPIADDLEHGAPHPSELRCIEAPAERCAKIGRAGTVARVEWQIGTCLDLYEGLRGQQHIVSEEEPRSRLPGAQSLACVAGGKCQLRLHAENRARTLKAGPTRCSVVGEEDVFDSHCDIAETGSRGAIVLT